MTRFTLRSLLLLVVLTLFPATVAVAQNTHNVWSKKPFHLTDGDTGKKYTDFKMGSASAAWTEGTTRAYFRAVAIIAIGTPKYDFELVKTTSSSASEIEGLFDIKRDGVLVCDDCKGKLYGLNQAVGNYFKLYVGTPAAYAEKWHYSGYIGSRFDF
ncbi:MAG TPA: hypothetical protein VKC61_23260 [Pyrinomonadaceae bacterium]|nr:hypothetical protein [Pyrinomonadaceae bacterium]